MIVTKYVIKETIKTQLAILFVLFLIFFSQKLVRILSSAVEGDIPSELVLPLLLLGIAEMARLILPLSLFLAILISFGRLYSENEMTAMFACGVKKSFLYRVVFILSIITGLTTIANSVWFSPWSNLQREQLIENAKINPSLAGLLAGQFQQTPKRDAVIYIGNVSNQNIDKIFLAQLNSSDGQRPSIIIAEKGKTSNDNDGNQVITLEKAIRYEGSALLRDFRISEFNNYQAVIKPKTATLDETEFKNDVENLDFFKLVKLGTPEAKTEYTWRLTLVLSVPLMAFLVIPLSAVNPRQGKLANFLPAILLYLIYFLAQSSIKSNAEKGRLDPELWMWTVNVVYFLIAVILNSWDSIFMRKLRYRFKLKGVAHV